MLVSKCCRVFLLVVLCSLSLTRTVAVVTVPRGMVSLVAGKNTGEKRDTEETAEEKRLRKAQIKQSKRVS